MTRKMIEEMKTKIENSIFQCLENNSENGNNLEIFVNPFEQVEQKNYFITKWEVTILRATEKQFSILQSKLEYYARCSNLDRTNWMFFSYKYK